MRRTQGLITPLNPFALLAISGLLMTGCSADDTSTDGASEVNVTNTDENGDNGGGDVEARTSAVWIMGMTQKLDPEAFGINAQEQMRANAKRPGSDAMELSVRYDGTGWLKVDIPLGMPLAPDYTVSLFSSAPDGAEREMEVTVGSLIGIRWNPEAGEEELFKLDPMTGQTITYGVVGDLTSIQWTYPVLVDQDRGLVYVDGFDASNTQKLYVMDMWTGDLLNTIAMNQPTAGWEINSEGAIIYFRWNDEARVQEMLRLDPTTGISELMGTVGDLEAWSQETVIDNANDRIYAFGKTGVFNDNPFAGLTEAEVEGMSQEELEALIAQNSTEQDKMYVLNSLTGELIRDAVVDELPLGVQLNSAGSIVYGRWNNAAQIQELRAINPETMEVSTLGQIDGPVSVVANRAEVEALDFPPDARMAYVTQTTLSVSD
ncbi:MAG: hypothetical protein AAFX99_33725, partial [Myxococcota bacterium]